MQNTSNNEKDPYGVILQGIGIWPRYIPISLGILLINKGKSQLQDKDCHFPISDCKWSWAMYRFEKSLQNGKKSKPDSWMCLSPLKISSFRFCCILFQQEKHQILVSVMKMDFHSGNTLTFGYRTMKIAITLFSIFGMERTRTYFQQRGTYWWLSTETNY